MERTDPDVYVWRVALRLVHLRNRQIDQQQQQQQQQQEQEQAAAAQKQQGQGQNSQPSEDGASSTSGTGTKTSTSAAPSFASIANTWGNNSQVAARVSRSHTHKPIPHLPTSDTDIALRVSVSFSEQRHAQGL